MMTSHTHLKQVVVSTFVANPIYMSAGNTIIHDPIWMSTDAVSTAALPSPPQLTSDHCGREVSELKLDLQVTRKRLQEQIEAVSDLKVQLEAAEGALKEQGETIVASIEALIHESTQAQMSTYLAQIKAYRIEREVTSSELVFLRAQNDVLQQESQQFKNALAFNIAMGPVQQPVQNRDEKQQVRTDATLEMVTNDLSKWIQMADDLDVHGTEGVSRHIDQLNTSIITLNNKVAQNKIRIDGFIQTTNSVYVKDIVIKHLFKKVHPDFLSTSGGQLAGSELCVRLPHVIKMLSGGGIIHKTDLLNIDMLVAGEVASTGFAKTRGETFGGIDTFSARIYHPETLCDIVFICIDWLAENKNYAKLAYPMIDLQ